jgi:hypothetical protein
LYENNTKSKKQKTKNKKTIAPCLHKTNGMLHVLTSDSAGEKMSKTCRARLQE